MITMSKKEENIDNKIAKSVKRQQMKDAGALDGRFNTKVEKDKSKYSRKKKHKKQGDL